MGALAGRKVVVYGLARSGLSALRLLVREGARVTGLDKAPEPKLGDLAALRAQGVTLKVGTAFDLKVLQEAECIVVSPGVPLSLPELVAARTQGLDVLGEIELASRYLPYPLVGITGTNGKSTTTALCGQLFLAAKRKTFVGGNLGTPLSEAVLASEPYEFGVVELSSFQLEGIQQARFHGAAILNLTPDHLDRYENAQAYGAAKKRIFLNQRAGDFAVVNADDAAVVGLASDLDVPVYGFTLQKKLAGRFAGGAEVTPEGFSLRLKEGGAETYQVTGRTLRGAHNRQNAMAAALLARASGIPADAVQRGLDTYPGLAHRLEFVRSLDGVDYINDSKATNVDSAVMALRALDQPLWLIAGGRGKGAPYTPMVEAARGKLRGVLTIGDDAPQVAAAFEGQAPVHACQTLEVALKEARSLAKAGEAVLLAPACASYDQYKNFEERGDQFKRLVEAL